MDRDLSHAAAAASNDTTVRAWQRPAAEVICLACELSAYAPDDGSPLF